MLRDGRARTACPVNQGHSQDSVDIGLHPSSNWLSFILQAGQPSVLGRQAGEQRSLGRQIPSIIAVLVGKMGEGGEAGASGGEGRGQPARSERVPGVGPSDHGRS